LLFHAQKPSVSDHEALVGFVSSMMGDGVAASRGLAVVAAGAIAAGFSLFAAAAAAISLHRSVSRHYVRQYMNNVPIVLFCEPLHLLRLQLFAKSGHANGDAGDGCQCNRENTSCHVRSSPVFVQTSDVSDEMNINDGTGASKKFGVLQGCGGRALANASSSCRLPL
jgi:hypothetical protein